MNDKEIKVGEYIRTKDGIIAKVIYVDSMMIDCDRNVFDLEHLAMMEIPTEYKKEYMTKHSSNIIDLIQEDDVGIMNCYGLLVKKFITKSDILELKLGNYKLLKVVTKEQFENAEYELED